jgi:hypothetical protein
MDRVLVALEGKPQSSAERWKGIILTAGAWLTLSSGLALATLSPLAIPLFVANAMVQGIYLIWATGALHPADADEEAGRQSTIAAFAVYAAAALFVVTETRVLRPWPAESVAQFLEIAGCAAETLLGWMSSLLNPASLGAKQSGPNFVVANQRSVLVNLRLRPDWQCFPLWDGDTGENVSPDKLDLPQELLGRIEMWDDNWQDTYNGDDPPSSGFKSEGDIERYRQEGKAIAAELAKVWHGKLEVDAQFL